jgi:hypothetical protein
MPTPPAPTGGAGICPAERCPLCGAPNDCQRCTSAAYKGPCWCESLTIPDELLAQVPEASRNLACICRGCVEAALRRRRPPKPGPGDTYLDSATGYVVFTAAYHRRRGYCCDSGCRHCPWKNADCGLRKAQSKDSVAQSSAIAFVESPVPGGRPPLPGGEGRGEGGSASNSGGGNFTRFLAVLLCLLALIHSAAAQTVTEDFATNPASHGWQSHGNTNLFHWDAAGQRLEVTWDTANPHSFFALPLATRLTTTDDFAVEFDLRLDEIQGGVRANRPGAMPLSVGFLNLSRALTNNYLRGAGRARDTLEFTWFPTGELPGFGLVDPTVSAITWDSAGKVAASFTFPVEPTTNTTFRVRLAYQAATRTVATALTADGTVIPLNPLKLPETFGSFDLDALAVMVWNEATSQSDSLFARATLDNVILELPPAPIGAVRMLGSGEVECDSRKGWNYHLEASGDLAQWSVVWTEAGTGGTLVLADVRDAVFSEQFYRVRAERE